MKDEILFVDSDPHLPNTLTPYFNDTNFSLTFVRDGQIAIKKALNQTFVAVILDLTPLHIDAFHIVKLIRKHSTVPILIQSNCDDDLARIIGLEYGADDYLIKPYNPLELISRIKTILRRAPQTTAHPTTLITHHELTLDLKTRQVLLADKILELTNTEFNILLVLMKSPGHVFSKSELTEYALGKTYTAYDRSIDVHISHLRTKLQDNSTTNEWIKNEWIKTVHGYGYLLNDYESST